jgi:hypothetical protein
MVGWLLHAQINGSVGVYIGPCPSSVWCVLGPDSEDNLSLSTFDLELDTSSTTYPFEGTETIAGFTVTVRIGNSGLRLEADLPGCPGCRLTIPGLGL